MLLRASRRIFEKSKKVEFHKTTLGPQTTVNPELGRTASVMGDAPIDRGDVTKETSTKQLKAAQGKHWNHTPASGTIFTEDQYTIGNVGGGQDDNCARTEGVLGETNYNVIMRNRKGQSDSGLGFNNASGAGTNTGGLRNGLSTGGGNTGGTPDWQMVCGPYPWFGMHINTHQKTGGGFGHPWDMGPSWILARKKDLQVGIDTYDWFFRAFNRTRIYENCLKTVPGWACFIVMLSIVGSYSWDRMHEQLWMWNNKGKLYYEHPYIYPPEDD